MGSQQNPQAKNYFKELLKKAQEAISIIIGNSSEAYSEEDREGDLKFDPSFMMKINVTFDKKFLPKEKVVKLNVRGNRFFQEIKRNIREINGLYIVYPREYQFQFDSYREEWEKRFIMELNEEYQLSLQKIRFVGEEEICRRFQRKKMTHIRNPYNLNKEELLIVAGGFANFNTDGEPLCSIKVNIVKKSPGKDTKIKKTYESCYYRKYSSNSGAYFYVGGDWYHNLFVPEMYIPEAPRFFSFRIADNGKSLKFFSDPNIRGVDIRSDVKTKTEPDKERIIYTINPDYLQETGILDFKLSIIYDVKGDEERRVDVPASVRSDDRTPIIPDTAKEGFPTPPKKVLTPDIPGTAKENFPTPPKEERPVPEIHVRTLERKKKSARPDLLQDDSLEAPAPHDENSLPYLKSEMILLPCPKDDDISSYMMTIGDKKKSVTFYTNSIDDEVSIMAPEKDTKIYKRKIGDPVDYSIRLGSITYSISNTFLSSIDDEMLKLYFAWELKTSLEEKIMLASDFYIFGREPLDNLGKDASSQTAAQLVRLNKSDEDFWRIGTSRDHALLLKDEKNHCHYFYNISLSFPVYVLKSKNLGSTLLTPVILEPVTDPKNKEKLATLLAKIKTGITAAQADPLKTTSLQKDLNQTAYRASLENNDLVIIGNKVFKYIVPMVMESPLSDRFQQSILRKINSTSVKYEDKK